MVTKKALVRNKRYGKRNMGKGGEHSKGVSQGM